MKWKAKPRKEFKNTGKWFAWYPVKIYNTNIWVWLQYVYWGYEIIHIPELGVETRYGLNSKDVERWWK